MTRLEESDIQGIILRGYGKLDISRFLLLQIFDGPSAKRWLGEIAGMLHPAAKGGRYDRKTPPDPIFNLALTYSGLQALGLKEANMQDFLTEFREGMVTPHRQRLLGDFGDSDPTKWRWGGPNNPMLHMMLCIYAADLSSMNAFCDPLMAQLSSSGLEIIGQLEGLTLPGRKEHFGFRDGIGQPVVQEHEQIGPDANRIAAGEFILGYQNEYDLYPDSPTIRDNQGNPELLPMDAAGSGRRDLGCNGSYMVFRQVSQDVQGFWKFLDGKSKITGGADLHMDKIKLASKFVGRWPSGAPITLHPDYDPKPGGISDADEFSYRQSDPAGEKCPIGAHIRRANPRDGLLDSNAKESVRIVNHHRIIRRGRAYGPPAAESMLPDDLLKAPPSSEEAGLYFICFNANIANQYQFQQFNWINAPKFERFYYDPDPLIGAQGTTNQPQNFTLPAEPVGKAVTGLQRFVEIRGGAYLFMPGIRAVRFLASLQENTMTISTTPSPSGFLAAYTALADSGQAPADIAKAQFALLSQWLTTKPAVLFAELRANRPIFIPSAGPVLITRYRDVIEALGLDNVFTVKPAAQAIQAIVGNDPFLLGMDDSPARDMDQAILRLAVKWTDVDTIRQFAAAQCKAITDSAASTGTLDLVQNYTSTIPLLLAGEYFGIPGPDIATLGAWLRAMFCATFRNPTSDPQIFQAGATAATAYRAYVATLVSAAHAKPSGRDTVIDRLIAMEADPQTSFDDQAIVHNVSSLLMGMIDTTNAAVNFAIDSLLNQPSQMAGAVAAAGGNDDLLLRYIFEAMRFNPPVSILARFSASAVTLAKGTDHPTLIPAGQLVYVALGSAMMDEAELDDPTTFRLDRPDFQYVHLGWGIHRCFGRHIAMVLMTEMVKGILALKNLRRAPGAGGQLAFDGVFLKSFSIAFDP